MTHRYTRVAAAVVAAMGAFSASRDASAQQGAAPAATSPSPQQLERVEITGSSIKRIDG